MARYWKNQFPYGRAVEAGAVVPGGSGAPGVSGPPVVSCPSNQDTQATPEQKRRTPGFAGAAVYQSEPRAISTEPDHSSYASGGESVPETASRGGAFVGESDCICENRPCTCTPEQVAAFERLTENVENNGGGALCLSAHSDVPARAVGQRDQVKPPGLAQPIADADAAPTLCGCPGPCASHGGTRACKWCGEPFALMADAGPGGHELSMEDLRIYCDHLCAKSAAGYL